jgi:hypothetical protein
MSVDGRFPVAMTVVWRGRMGKSPSESIVTEVLSDGLALGYYVWGPPTKSALPPRHNVNRVHPRGARLSVRFLPPPAS